MTDEFVEESPLLKKYFSDELVKELSIEEDPLVNKDQANFFKYFEKLTNLATLKIERCELDVFGPDKVNNTLKHLSLAHNYIPNL